MGRRRYYILFSFVHHSQLHNYNEFTDARYQPTAVSWLRSKQKYNPKELLFYFF